MTILADGRVLSTPGFPPRATALLGVPSVRSRIEGAPKLVSLPAMTMPWVAPLGGVGVAVALFLRLIVACSCSEASVLS